MEKILSIETSSLKIYLFVLFFNYFIFQNFLLKKKDDSKIKIADYGFARILEGCLNIKNNFKKYLIV